MNSNITFTVFTPTYNRENTLHRVFESLEKQSGIDFEWLVVDDGSTDDTAVLIQQWQARASFPIRYFYQTNQGKHIAFNKGVREAQGQFFVPLDSDDACVANALSRFLALWEAIPNKELYSGVCVLCQDQKGRKVGDDFPQAIFNSNSCEILYKYGIKGEKWGFHRTDILKQYPFPEVAGVKFIPECLVWHNIAKKYQLRCVNEALRIYFIEGASNNSLTSLASLSSIKKAKLLYYQWVLNNDIHWFFHAPLIFLKYAFQYARYSLYFNSFTMSNIMSKLAKALILLLYLPALAVTICEKNIAKD
jgi:glycosyltransferase involved in cell wall biosynthesis